MGRAEKLLSQMLADQRPVNYTYDDAAAVLQSLGFEPARSKPSGSHRVWRREVTDGGTRRSVYVGLVDHGHGTLKAVYIKQMLRVLMDNGLIPRQY